MEDWESAPIITPASKPESGPWEAYQTPAEESGPWQDYQTPLERQQPGVLRTAFNEANKALGAGLRPLARAGGFGLPGMLAAAEKDTSMPVEGHGVADALSSGFQSSATGLMIRGKLPSVVLDPHHAKWYEKLASGAAQVASDLPEMTVGALFGAGGGPAGAGATAFATPTLIRTALTEAYSKGEVTSAADFLGRAGIVIKATAKDATVGAATSGTGAIVSKLVGPLVPGAAGKWLTGASSLAAETGMMTVAPALLEGKLPEPEDFSNAAILAVGLKGAHIAAARMRAVFAKTGVEPAQVLVDSKTDPTIKEDLQKMPTPEEQAQFDKDVAALGEPIPRAYQEMAARQSALDAFPGEKAQQVLDRPFADIPDTKLPYQLNLKYIEGPEDLHALQTRFAEVYRVDIDAARGGTQSWAETEAKAARQVADMTGRELRKVMDGRQVGDTANAVELKIQGDLLMQATVEAAEAVKRVKDAGNDVSDTMRMDALEAIHRSAMIQADFTGASSEVGRALQYLKRVKEVRAQGEGIQKLVEMYGSDPDTLLKMAADMDSPQALAKFAREATKATTEQMLLEAWKAGLVSGPFTQIANVMGNTTYMALRPLVDLGAAGIGMITRASERVSAVEPLARVFGDLHGVMDGLKLAKAAFLTDGAGGKAESRQAIPGAVGYVIRTPFRALGAMDQVFRTMTERGEAYALGARQAVEEGFNPATREFRERVAEIANNPTEAQIEQIQKFGERGTFTAPLGEKGQAISHAIVTAHLEFAAPFRGTPANIFKEMARLTPAAPIIKEWREAVAMGGVEAQKALAEVAVGTGVAALTMTLAAAGHISGAGDPDPNKRRVQAAAGWQPYSIKIGNTWHSYQRFQPVGTLVGLAADAAEAWQHLTPEESDKVPKILGTAFANAVTSQTFLQGISQLIAAVAHPERDMVRFINSLSASTVPALVGQTAQMLDPYQREITSIREAVINRIPGLRQTLPPQRDPFGEPVPSAERIGVVSPVTVKEQSQDKVHTEAARLGISATRTPKNIQLPAAGIGKIGTVALTPEQRDIFGDVAGHTAYNIMQPLVNTPGWDHLNDEYKIMAYKKAFEAGHKMGKANALTDEQRQKEVQRIVGEVSKRLNR